jgi:hypothetical protein
VFVACGDAPPPQPEEPEPPGRGREFRRRLLEEDWNEVGEWKADDLVRGLFGYVDSDDPAWPHDDMHYRSLQRFLARERPDPAGLRPLIAAHRGKDEVDTHLLKRDKIARAVVHSFMMRIDRARRRGQPDEVAALWDGLVFAGIHFSFEAVYEASHPGTGESLAEFFSDPEMPACAESKAAFERHIDALMKKWRARVTRKATSLYFGNLLRHMGPGVADRLYAEWEGMDGNERYDLLRRTDGNETLGPDSRVRLVHAILDDSYEVREAAFENLRGLEAPLGDLDASAQESRLEAARPALLKWASKTDS